MRTPEDIHRLGPDSELTRPESDAYLIWLAALHEERRLLRDDLPWAEDWERAEIWDRLDEINAHLEKDHD